MGHGTIGATEIYTHVSVAKLKEEHARTHPSWAAGTPLLYIRPVNGAINVGGLGELGEMTNLNDLSTPMKDVSAVRNLVIGHAEDIGDIFHPDSATLITSKRLPATVDFTPFADGAYQAMRDLKLISLPRPFPAGTPLALS